MKAVRFILYLLPFSSLYCMHIENTDQSALSQQITTTIVILQNEQYAFHTAWNSGSSEGAHNALHKIGPKIDLKQEELGNLFTQADIQQLPPLLHSLCQSNLLPQTKQFIVHRIKETHSQPFEALIAIEAPDHKLRGDLLYYYWLPEYEFEDSDPGYSPIYLALKEAQAQCRQ